jgi:S-adenosylhomocysteine hydrolase
LLLPNTIATMPFPKLQTLEEFVEQIQRTSRAPLKGIHIICVQHLLETTGSLLDGFVRLGCRPSDIHVLGKLYSTSLVIEDRLRAAAFDVAPWQGKLRAGRFSEAMRQNVLMLWSRVESRLTPRDHTVLILDDGGRCRQFMPTTLFSRRIIGIEQTTSGLRRRRTTNRIPTVEVAGSAAKCILEPPAVTASIMRFIIPQLDGFNPNGAIGVIGLGTVGEDLVRKLVSKGRRVNVYDKSLTLRGRLPGVQWCNSLQKLFETSACILGCTGEDLLHDAGWLLSLKGDRVLASCSSEDVEFKSLLKHAPGVPHSDPLGTVEIRLPRGSLKILRAGFPANFVGTKNSGPIALIQVTRALLLAGVLQAARLASRPPSELPGRIMLDPEFQAAIGRAFLTPRRRRLLGPHAASVLDAEWAAAHSTGIRLAADW